jgi:hypothetical protein
MAVSCPAGNSSQRRWWHGMRSGSTAGATVIAADVQMRVQGADVHWVYKVGCRRWQQTWWRHAVCNRSAGAIREAVVALQKPLPFSCSRCPDENAGFTYTWRVCRM